jgi:hypothetical protein
MIFYPMTLSIVLFNISTLSIITIIISISKTVMLMII